jgi:hypothetical protein
VKSPQNEIPPCLEAPCDQAETALVTEARSPSPLVSTPPRLLNRLSITTAFQIAKPIVRKALERFLSDAGFGRGLRSPPRRISRIKVLPLPEESARRPNSSNLLWKKMVIVIYRARLKNYSSRLVYL